MNKITTNIFFKILKYLLFLLIAYALLSLAFKNQNPEELLQQLLAVNYSWVIISMIFGLLTMISRSYRWLILLDSLNYKSNIKNSVCAVGIGYLTNIIIPRAGEITRCTTLSKIEKIPFDKLFGTIVLERIIDLLILFTLSIITLIVHFNHFTEFLTSVIILNSEKNLTKLFLIFLFIMFSFFLIIILFRKKIKASTLYTKISNFLNGFKEGVNSIKSMKKSLNFWIHTAFIWILYFLMTYVCFFSIEETASLNLTDGLLIMIIGGLGMVVPTQGGIGSYHLAVKIGLVGLGISASSSLLYAFTVHTGQLIITLFFGTLSLLLLFNLKKKNNVSSKLPK